MEDLDTLLASMRRTFQGDAESELARVLLDFLSAHPSTKHISLQFMRQLAGDSGSALDIAIVRTLQYLSGPSVELLDAKFELLQDDDLEPVLLSDDEIGSATRDKVNPITGEFDAELDKKIAIFFSPTDLMKGLLAPSSRKNGGG